MFSKGSKKASAGSTSDSARSAKTSVPSIISSDLRINGDLVCSGDVQVDGWVEGDIQSRNIVIGEAATVHGALQAETVRICGLVKGAIKADSVVLEKTAKVTGDILHKTLTIEEGAQLEGMCKRLDAPTAQGVLPAPAVAANETKALASSDAIKPLAERIAAIG
ncbi:bactofilin family protein [Dongia deserti]|uniref:bactofilin family protein n=1 Tax=Dongia deserti TaxID=2268030 RepID=UPI000E65B430|nr:polymer-forming cytoskeletal protein [Dongia deserti]